MVTQDSVEHAFRIHNEKTLEDNPWVPNTDDLINEDWELVKKKVIEYMKDLYKSLKEYFENTSQEQLDKDWKEIEPLNKIGPDVPIPPESINE